ARSGAGGRGPRGQRQRLAARRSAPSRRARTETEVGRMRSIGLSSRLRTTFAEFVDAAAAILRADVAGGAEVPFELASHRGRAGARATLYCYQPLTRTYIAERREELARLPEHAVAAGVLEGLPGLDRYLASRGLAPEPELSPAQIIAADLRPGDHVR